MTAALPFIDELRRVPADRLEETAEFIHTLLEERRARRESIIDATAGSLTGEEGAALESALAEYINLLGQNIVSGDEVPSLLIEGQRPSVMQPRVGTTLGQLTHIRSPKAEP